MKNKSWQGLVTNASPYAIPPGSAVEQVNAQTNVPGQINSRKGMARIPVVEGRVAPVDVQSVSIGDQVYLFGTTDNGLELFNSPGIVPSTESGVVPVIAADEDATSTNYLLHYFASGIQDGDDPVDPVDPIDPEEPEPPDTDMSNVISGGNASAIFTYCVDANECESEIESLEGGTATTTSFSPPIDRLLLCSCASDGTEVDPVVEVVEEFDLTDANGNVIVDHNGNELNTQPPFTSENADLIETHEDVVITTETESGLYAL